MTEILDTCRIFRDIDKHPLPEKTCKIDVKLKCGSELLNCDNDLSILNRKQNVVYFYDHKIGVSHITKWRLSK
jgi:hypothetical protein